MALQRRAVLSVLALLLLLLTLLLMVSQESLMLLVGHRVGAVVVELEDGAARVTRPPGVNESASAPRPPSPSGPPSTSPPPEVGPSPATASPGVDPGPSTSTSRSAANGSSVVKVFKGEPTVGEEHILFVETSCALSDTPAPASYDSESGVRLSARAACALESAAAAHPERPVYLVHTCGVREEALARGAAPAYVLAALARPNVRLWGVHYAALFARTPLERWLASGALARSLWPVVHASDVVRFLLLWKYGGTYLDLDVLMLRSLGGEKNFGCAESTIDVSVGAFNFAMDKIGRVMAEACLAELQDYRPNLWSYNGPGVITRALKKICNVTEISQMTARTCGGFHLLPTSAFYEVPWQAWELFFDEKNADDTMKRIKDKLATHVWNALSHGSQVRTLSMQPYAQIARRVCPSVVAAVGDTI